MRYVSTRGGEPCGFFGAIVRGRAPNGGLCLPQDWPQLTLDDIASAARRPLAQTVEMLLLRFAGRELDPEMALPAVREALTAFGHPAVAPLREYDANLWLLDLARGPTMSAPDAEMQVLARLIGRTATERGGALTLLLATDGHDGPAAVEAFRERAGVGLVVLFPADGVTPAQRQAMTDPGALNVRAVEVETDASGCRQLATAALADRRLATDLRLGSIGSENVGRVVVSAALLLAAGARLGAPERTVSFGAPAGESSVAFAAEALTQMGFGSGPVILADGDEGGLAGALAERRYGRSDASGSTRGMWSSAFERLYFEAVDRHVVETARAAQAFAEAGCIDLSPTVRHRLSQVVQPVSIQGSEVQGEVMAALNVAGERLDPASAAVAAAVRRSGATALGPVVCPRLSHPAWGWAEIPRDLASDLPPQLRRPAGAMRCDRLPADVEALGAYLRAFAGLSRAA